MKTSAIYYPAEEDEQERRTYYAAVSAEAAPSFAAIHELLKSTHSSPLAYDPSRYVYPHMDVYEDGRLRSIYSGRSFSPEELIQADQQIDRDRQQRFTLRMEDNALILQDTAALQKEIEKALPYNCEHVVCQSWFDERDPMRGDLHHLFACESDCNSFRNNFPYNDFADYTPEADALADAERPFCGFQEDGMFEPQQNKGVVARAVLYFLLRYPGAIDKYDSGDIGMLQDWSNSQPVDVYERHRNREISLLQGNRNPLIDFPQWANSIDFEEGL